MANSDEDVIELGSSEDEEWQPTPKKKKPMKNVMVKIPNKLPELTIKPSSRNNINLISLTRGKPITVTKVSNPATKVSNPFAVKNIMMNGRNIVQKQTNPRPVNRPGPMPVIKSVMSVKQTFQKIGINPIPTSKLPIKIARGISTAPILQASLPLGTLPPGITVKRTSQLQSAAKRVRPNPINMQAKQSVSIKTKKINKMMCVNVDEEDAAPSSVGRQWYLRPEDQDKCNVLNEKPKYKHEPSLGEVNTIEMSTNEVENETNNENETDLQKQNNKEPDTTNYIEITIEDSPAKPHKNKRACEVSDLAITIDDSPVKGASNKVDDTIYSDEETTTSKEKNSKKKLEYPNQNEKESEPVEIEIELTPVADTEQNDKTDSQEEVETVVVEIEESPLKPAESFQTSTPKKRQKPKLPLKMNNRSLFNPLSNQHKINNSSQPQTNNTTVTTTGEFHPIYQSFIDLCFKLENSEDMKKIAEKKIIAYYKQVPKEYTESEVFTDMVASKISAMKAGPEKMYLYIKDVVDELNLQRKIAKSQPVNVVTVNKEQEKLLYGEESEFDMTRQRQIRKLEKTLKKLHRAIQKLEEQEVDFDDEEDSVYLLTESGEEAMDCVQPIEKSTLLKRYKERMIRVHAKFCQLTNTKMPSEPRVQIDARPGQPKGPAKRLEKWINKKVPIGTPLPFPDFHDVLRCVREANQEDKLMWNEADIMEEARDLFTRCGKKLQRRRQENEWRLAASRIQAELDPAEESEDLKKALENNRREASKKENEVFNKYADRQNQMNLEAVEIEDKDADESPVDTDDEEHVEESSSPDTKEKRKERLKRLLQKKSKKQLIEKSDSIVKPKEPEDKCQDTGKNDTEKPDVDLQAEAASNEKDPSLKDKNDADQDPLSEEQAMPGSENVQTLSEDSSKIDSDVDELHLLQKLHSNVIDSSTLESSDSESPIAISDTLSSGDNKKRDCDVISIENSSYSESEKIDEQENEIVSYSQKKIVKESVDDKVEIECSEIGIEKKINKSNNDEYNESVEDILLASSDDEANKVEKDDTKNGHISSVNNISKYENDTTHIECSSNNADVIDADSMESVENAGTKNIECENPEVISVTSTDTGDDNTNGTEVTAVEIVENENMADTIANSLNQDTCNNAVKMKNTDGNFTGIEDMTMSSITENDNTNKNNDKLEINSDLQSIDKNVDVKVTSSKITKEIDKLNTPEVNGESKTITLNVKSINNTTTSEPMEVDDDKT